VKEFGEGENTVIVSVQNILKQHLDFPKNPVNPKERPYLGNHLLPSTPLSDIFGIQEVKVDVLLENPILVLPEKKWKEVIATFPRAEFTLRELIERLKRVR
jgi:hypothetical protein